MQKRLSLLHKRHADEVSHLLSVSFANAKGFVATGEASKWTMADDFYPVLGIRHNGKLVSVMRIEWILSTEELSFKIKDCPLDQNIVFPAVYLTKAGTLPECREQGLNLTLRYFSFLLADVWKARHVLGSMVEGSPRILSMKEMGYNFFQLPNKWQGLYQSEAIPLMAVLDLNSDREKAFRYLIQRTEDYRRDLTLDFDISSIQIKPSDGMHWPWLKQKK